MESVVLVIHLMIAAALVGLVLLQRSEGGALGIGGGGGGGGFMTGRGTANLLTRTTAVLAAVFFLTSITLTLLAQKRSEPASILESGIGSNQPDAKKDESGGLPKLQPSVPEKPSGPQVPKSQ